MNRSEKNGQGTTKTNRLIHEKSPCLRFNMPTIPWTGTPGAQPVQGCTGFLDRSIA
ncbi:MAG: hypothetical protein NTY16_08260 [Deltaproteobacteria bacterium]|nr:hypothetical protein [Deltaproteobacteria bacterium]